METRKKKELILKILAVQDSFYLDRACKFLHRVGEKTWYELPNSQISALVTCYEQAKRTGKNTQEAIQGFLKNQAEKEDKPGREARWQVLYSATEPDKRLVAFLSPDSETIRSELQTYLDNLSRLLERGKGRNSIYAVTIAEAAADVLRKPEASENEQEQWQNEKLLPLVTEKLFYTLVTLHRLYQATKNKNKTDAITIKKEWLPCSPSTN